MPAARPAASLPRRLVIVDPSLRDPVGHHLAYDAALAGAARAAGLDVAVLAHGDGASLTAEEPSIVPAFSADMWEERHRPMERAVRRLRHLHALAALPLLPWRRKRKTPPPGWRQLSASAAPPPRPLAFLLMRNAKFRFELDRAFRQIDHGPGDLVLTHMIVDRNVLEWALWVDASPSNGRPPPVLLFRYPAPFLRPWQPQTVAAFRLLARAVKAGRVRLATDGDRLADAYAPLLGRRPEVLPIPHTDFPACPPSDPGGPLRLGHLGTARAEKGFLEVVEAAGLLAAGGADPPFRLALQVTEPDRACAPVIASLRQAPPPWLELVEGPLEPGEYARLLAGLDAVLVPYRRDAYAERTSGVFLEAVAAGKPVVATRGTWMEDELARWGSGELVDGNGSAAELAAALRALLAGLSDHRALAERTAPVCRAFHSPASLLAHLLAGASPSG